MTFNFQIIFCSLGDKIRADVEIIGIYPYTHYNKKKNLVFKLVVHWENIFGSLSIPMNKLEQIKKKFRRDPY